MTDDLDDLLSDVEGGRGSKNRNDGEVSASERSARRSDRPVVDARDPSSIGKFKERILGLRLDGDLDPFRESLNAAANVHSDLVVKFRETIFSNLVVEHVGSIIKKYRYAYEKSLGNIDQSISDYCVHGNLEKILKLSRQNFYLYFANQEITDGRLNFLVIKDLFLVVRDFNTHIKKEWSELQKSIHPINGVYEGKQLFSICDSIISDALVFCEKTEKFISFLRTALMLNNNDRDILEREIPARAVYFDSFDYNIVNLLALDKNESINQNDDFLDLTAKETPEILVSDLVETQESPAEQNEYSSAESSFERTSEEKLSESTFTVKGTNAWNTKEPYVIKIDYAALRNDYSDLRNSIYFNNAIPDPVTVNGQVKRALILFLKNPEKHILDDYHEFVLRYISFKIDSLYDYFGFTGEQAKLFVYHLAPLTMFKIISTYFQESGQGICFKLLPAHKVARYVPMEYLKEQILVWYEMNINILDLPFDRVSDYNEIKRKIQEKFTIEKKSNEAKIAAAIEKIKNQTGRIVDPALVLQKKSAELFGPANVFVFNRFLDKTGLK